MRTGGSWHQEARGEVELEDGEEEEGDDGDGDGDDDGGGDGGVVAVVVAVGLAVAGEQWECRWEGSKRKKLRRQCWWQFGRRCQELQASSVDERRGWPYARRRHRALCVRGGMPWQTRSLRRLPVDSVGQ